MAMTGNRQGIGKGNFIYQIGKGNFIYQFSVLAKVGFEPAVLLNSRLSNSTLTIFATRSVNIILLLKLVYLMHFSRRNLEIYKEIF